MLDHQRETSLSAAFLAESYALGTGGFSQDPHWAYIEAKRAAHHYRLSHEWLLLSYEGISRRPGGPSVEGWYFSFDGQEYGPYPTQSAASRVRGLLMGED